MSAERRHRAARASWYAACALLALCASGAHAQSEQRDVHAAARAFAEAQRAQLRGDAESAARLYELADSIAPTPEALRSAIRSHRDAGHRARAATLARSAERRYPEDAETGALAGEVLAALAPELAELVVRCAEPCTIAVDGHAAVTSAVAELELFVEPGVHALHARFGAEREAHDGVELAAGERASLEFAPPPPPPVDAQRDLLEVTAASAESAPVPARDVQHERGLPPALFFTSAGVTAALSAAALVSGLDMLAKRERYREAPTRERYDSGVASQTRTNVLLVGAGAFAALTAGLAFFTDWDDGESAPVLSASPDGAALVLRRSFP